MYLRYKVAFEILRPVSTLATIPCALGCAMPHPQNPV